jgi:hypothetical protein
MYCYAYVEAVATMTFWNSGRANKGYPFGLRWITCRLDGGSD